MMEQQQGQILGGDLETLGLQATLKMLSLGGKTGILSVTSGQERMKISLKEGSILSLEEPGVQPPDIVEIFRLLLRIQREDAARLRQMAGNSPLTAMAILSDWGVISADEVQKRVEFGIVQALSRAVRWERGRFEFHRDIAPIQSRLATHKPLNVDHVLLEALRLADEREHSGTLNLSRNTVARWMPTFSGDVRQLGLSTDDVSVLCLANGQLPLYAVAYGLMIPEARVSAILHNLLNLGLIELVDARLEAELERSLMNLLTQGQHALSQGGRATPEQRMMILVRAMGTCTNGLLAHHAMYARKMRGRGEVPHEEAARYIESQFRPLLYRMQQQYPRMDEIVRFERGQLVYDDLESLDRVVRGQELSDCYWDAVQLFYQLLRLVLDRIVADEAGQTRIGRQFADLWAAFLREVDEEIRRLAGRRAALRA